MTLAMTDGSVLFIGGCVADSCDNGPASATVDRFDPATRAVTRIGNLTGPRNSAGAVVLPDQTVLVAGGWGARVIDPSIEIFDPRTGRSRALGELTVVRDEFDAVHVGAGRVLFIGPEAAELFDSKAGRIERVIPTLRRQVMPAMSPLPDGRWLLAGGGVRGAEVVGDAQLFDPRTLTFTPTGSMIAPRRKHAAVALADGRVLIVGGSDAGDRRGKIRRIEIYDPKTGRFEKAGETLEPRFKVRDAVVVLRSGKVLIAGGAERPEIYDPATHQSRLLDVSLGAPWNFACAVGLPNGDVVVAGGYDERTIRPTDQVWVLPKASLA